MKTLTAYILFLATMLAGWITNVVWTFHQETLGNIALGILGAVMAPIGAIHGIYLWF